MPVHEPDLPGLPHTSRALFRVLYAEPARDLDELRAQCERYAGQFLELAKTNSFIEPAKVRRIARLCVAMIDQVSARPRDHDRRLVQAAARYFVIEDDGDEDDFIGGLDDDLALAEAVARVLGREDLLAVTD